ncbi:MAG: zonula occludens toxin [Campylobacter sp.]|nr:zonula occludens toxin [Campylobacter sp.]
MAISYLTGIPKSGKTYLAVYKIWENFVKEPKKSFFAKEPPKNKYEICYTNINEFDFSKSDKIELLKVDDFKYNLSLLYDLYQAGANDTELNLKADEFRINHALIVIDEAHNFFTKKDDILTWWLTYHAHLYQDIWLITQDLSLIDTGYKAVAEYFYKAVEPARRLITSRFRYQQFSSYKMNGVDLIKGGGFTLPAIDEVFKMYVAGEKTKGSSIVVKFFALALILAFITFVAFNLYIKTLSPKNEEIKEEPIKQIQTQTIQEPIKEEKKENEILPFIYEVRCYYETCKISDKYEKFDLSYLSFLLSRSPPEFAKRKAMSKGVLIYIVGFKKPVFENLKKEEKNEKSLFDNNLLYGSDKRKRDRS